MIISEKSKSKLSRKKRKARWIKAKNQRRKYPDCDYGEYYCEHIYDEAYPWTWVDFNFLHTTHRHIFSVAMITAEFEALERAEQICWDEIDRIYPTEQWGRSTISFTKSDEEFYKRLDTFNGLLNEELKKPQIIVPHINVIEYSPVVTGIHTTVNTEFINEHVIRNFVELFRAFGEPTTHGWHAEEEPIEVTPTKFIRGTSAA